MSYYFFANIIIKSQTAMGKGYYWIEPVDRTLNDFQFYKARIVGDPEYDERHHRVILRTDKYFPVGSIFHVLNDKEMFVIERKFKIWGNKYVIRPCEGEWEWESVQKLKDKAIIFRTGFLHGDGSF